MYRKIIALKLTVVLAVMLLVLPTVGCDKSMLKTAQEITAYAGDIESTLSSLLPANDPRRPQITQWRNGVVKLEARLKHWDGQDAAPIVVNLAIVVEGFRTLVLPEINSSPSLRLVAALTDGGLRLLTRRFKKLAEEQTKSNGAAAAATLNSESVRESARQCEEYLRTPAVKKPDK